MSNFKKMMLTVAMLASVLSVSAQQAQAHGYDRGGGFAFGLGLGILGGAALGQAYGYNYPYGYYAAPQYYAPPPVYVQPYPQQLPCIAYSTYTHQVFMNGYWTYVNGNMCELPNGQWVVIN